MQKHYDMQFFGAKGEPLELFSKEFNLGDKAYIHSESHHILEPQVGDLVDLVHHGFAFVTEREGNNINCCLFDVNTGVFRDGYWHLKWVKIILRNGLAFMWPEEEPTE